MESRILQLISALRSSGVRVSLAETTEAFSAIDLMGIQNREQFRVSLRATIIKDIHDLPVFDRLFPLFFGVGQAPLMGGTRTDQLSPVEAQMLADALRQFSQRIRDRLERLMNAEPLSPEELEALAETVGLHDTADVRFHNVFAQRMLQAVGFSELRAALQELADLLVQMGMDRDRAQELRDLLGENLRGVEDQIRQFAGQRLAENMSGQPPLTTLDGLMSRPFEALSDEDKKALKHEVARLAAALRTRIALRQKRAKSGHLDPKATIRANLRYQGIPMILRHRNRLRKPRLVVICDVSTSMRFCAELMLSLLFALQGQVRKTYTFAFIDHLESIAGDFDGSHADQAVLSVLRRMPSGHYNTDLGWSLNDFNQEYMDTLNGQTTLIFLGDGRNNFNDPRVDLFAQMSRRAARTIWLNPEPQHHWDGDSDMPKYAPLCTNVFKVGNLQELAAAVDQLLSV